MRKRNIMIIGGGTQTKSLAESLLLKNNNVTVICNDDSLCNRLAEINGLDVIAGDGRQTSVLEDADINRFDIAITMYEHDADNLVVCELAKKVFGVGKTISLVSDVKRKPLFDAMGVDSVICAIDMVSATLEQQTVSDQLNRIVPTADGRVRISEIVVTDNSSIVGRTLAEIDLPSQTIIGCIIRGEDIIIPFGATVILAGDNLLLITSAEKEQAAIKVITGK